MRYMTRGRGTGLAITSAVMMLSTDTDTNTDATVHLPDAGVRTGQPDRRRGHHG